MHWNMVVFVIILFKKRNYARAILFKKRNAFYLKNATIAGPADITPAGINARLIATLPSPTPA